MESHKDESNTPIFQVEKHQPDVRPAADRAASPPPSSTSSPSREFSFTIALHKPPPLTANKTQSTPPLGPTIDLSPADEIFFHGHLLPLHLLPHHHRISSARSSTNSLESFITFTLEDEFLHNLENNNNNDVDVDNIDRVDSEGKARARKSRSLSHLFPKWRKHHHHDDDDQDHDHDHDDHHHHDHHHKHRIWRPRFNMVKRYIRLVKPYIHIPFVRHKRAGGDELLLRDPTSLNSYSGRLRVMKKSKKDSLVIRAGRSSEFSSAPVSIKTSPANSGLLVAADYFKFESAVDEIQAAIAHCKNSSISYAQEKGDHDHEEQQHKTT